MNSIPRNGLPQNPTEYLANFQLYAVVSLVLVSLFAVPALFVFLNCWQEPTNKEIRKELRHQFYLTGLPLLSFSPMVIHACNYPGIQHSILIGLLASMSLILLIISQAIDQWVRGTKKDDKALLVSLLAYPFGFAVYVAGFFLLPYISVILEI